MGGVSCRIDKEKISVGDHLVLSCSGNDNAGFSFDKSFFKSEESQKYKIKLFKIKPDSGSDFSIDYTIYAPGDYKISDLILTDGTNEINLQGPSVKVESVIKPSADGKPTEPFGAILPIRISTPLFYYIILLALILVLAGYAFYRIRRKIYYKKLNEKLKQYVSPIDIDSQFYKAIRITEKAGYPLDQLEKAFRLYSLRAYQLPMFDLSNERISKYFRRLYPEYKATRLSLNKLLAEFEELQKNNNLNTEEKHEFVKKLYRFADSHKGLGQ